jgi:hypothetical protein
MVNIITQILLSTRMCENASTCTREKTKNLQANLPVVAAGDEAGRDVTVWGVPCFPGLEESFRGGHLTGGGGGRDDGRGGRG